jgi:hypothetical protein
MIRSAVPEHDFYLISRRMPREYLRYQRPPIACPSRRLEGGIIFMNHAPSSGGPMSPVEVFRASAMLG